MLTTSLIGMTAIASAVAGYFMTHVQGLNRLLFFVGGLLMIDPKLLTDLIGLGLLAVG